MSNTIRQLGRDVDHALISISSAELAVAGLTVVGSRQYRAAILEFVEAQLNGTSNFPAAYWRLLLDQVDEPSREKFASRVTETWVDDATATVAGESLAQALLTFAVVDARSADSMQQALTMRIEEGDAATAESLGRAARAGSRTSKTALSGFGPLGPRKSPKREAYSAAKRALRG